MFFYFFVIICVKVVKFVKTLTVIRVLFHQIYSWAVIYAFNSKWFVVRPLLVSIPTFYGFEFVREVYPR